MPRYKRVGVRQQHGQKTIFPQRIVDTCQELVAFLIGLAAVL